MKFLSVILQLLFADGLIQRERQIDRQTDRQTAGPTDMAKVIKAVLRFFCCE
jgi:hypothetical protein